nr:ubiquitin carboxyl-terminal hydrolase 8-like [Leptinotarsa decemlineata]
MMDEILQSQNNEERCYILGRRYINLIDHVLKVADDPNFTRSMFIADYQKAKKIVTNLKVSLRKRYKTEATLAHGQECKTESNSLESEQHADSSANTSPSSYIVSCVSNEYYSDAPMFIDNFISPTELLSAKKKVKNMLVVDIRKAEDFNDSRLLLDPGLIINIPEDLILPGLSANALGHNLNSETGAIWDKRELYNMIILMDYDTTNHTFPNSKLERLRKSIVEWDVNRRYEREPYILNGGLKEFVDWYPSEVDNSQIVLSQINSEIDELLDLESITYPDSESTVGMNLKMHSINAVHNLESRVQRDVGAPQGNDEVSNHNSRSGASPLVDFCVSMDTLSGEPFSSLLQNSLSTEYPSTDFTNHTDFFTLDKSKKALNVNEGHEIDKVIADMRAALLQSAREAVKPVIDKDISKDQDNSGFSEKNKIVERPLIIRSVKPSLLPERVIYGEGYTGLRNVGNICYMNCMIQCLKVIPIIKAAYVTSDLYLKCQTKNPPKINHIMADVFREIWKGSDSNQNIFFIEEFKKKIVEIAPQFGKNTHEDAFEFFIFLSKVINEDCSLDLLQSPVMTEQENAWYSLLQGHTSFWVDTFYHQMKNSKTCYKCRQPNLSFETDSTLMLPVGESTSYLQLLIDEYMRENLVFDYSCSNCKTSAAIVNKKEIIVDPDVLVIVLKRYIANPDGTYRKNNALIEFPLEDLSFGSSKYTCYSIVQHNGTMTHGHYFATVLLDNKNKHWVSFNDEQVARFKSPVNESLSIQKSAVGFFYVRQGTN